MADENRRSAYDLSSIHRYSPTPSEEVARDADIKAEIGRLNFVNGVENASAYDLSHNAKISETIRTINHMYRRKCSR